MTVIQYTWAHVMSFKIISAFEASKGNWFEFQYFFFWDDNIIKSENLNWCWYPYLWASKCHIIIWYSPGLPKIWNLETSLNNWPFTIKFVRVYILPSLNSSWIQSYLHPYVAWPNHTEYSPFFPKYSRQKVAKCTNFSPKIAWRKMCA